MAAYLAPPTILGPVSACNKSVWLDNLVTQLDTPVTAVVEMDGLQIGSAVVTSTSMAISLTMSLKAGATLRARQWAKGWEGDVTPDVLAVTVAPAPGSANEVGAPVLRAPVSECGLCACFDGIYPGASVTVYDAYDNPLNTPVGGAGGTVIVPFSAPLQSTSQPALGGSLKAMQLVNGIPSPAVSLPPLAAAPAKLPVPRPRILRQCQSSVEVDGLAVGARLELEAPLRVVLTYYHGKLPSVCASGDTGTMRGLPPMYAGETLRVRQRLDGCSTPSDFADLPVSSAPPPSPVIAPYCLGDPFVRLSNLVADAAVEVIFGDQFLMAQPSGDTYDVPVPDALQPLNSQIFARQGFRYVDGSCPWSVESGPAQLTDPLNTQLGQPVISPPVESCANVIRVTGVVPDRRVAIEVQDFNDPTRWWEIGFAWATDAQVDVPVNATFLPPGRHCRPVELDCGERTVGPAMTVLSISRSQPWVQKSSVQFKGFQSAASAAPWGQKSSVTFGGGPTGIQPVIRSPLFDCGSIHVSNVVPGAMVDFYRVVTVAKKGPNSVFSTHLEWLMTVASPTSTLSVMRPTGLRLGETLAVQQRICDLLSPLSAPEPIVGGKVARSGIAVMCTEDGVATPLTADDVNVGTDLGISVEHNGKTYLFFGDVIALGATVKPIFRIDGPPEPCPTLVHWDCAAWPLTAQSPSTPTSFQSLVVDGLSLEGGFQVPSGAFSYDGRMYVFVTKTVPNSQVNGANDPNPDAMASSYLVSATSDCQLFRQEYNGDPVDTWQHGDPRPDSWLRFINVCPVIVSNADWPGLPSNTGDGLLLFGTGNYRNSDVCLAWVPLTPGESIPHPKEWWFLTKAGSPASFEQGEMRTLLDPTQAAQAGLLGTLVWGELSVTWIPGLSRWLMVPTRKWGTIEGFLARSPWGPWDERITIWEESLDGALGMQLASNPYGNYMITKLTRMDVANDTAIVYLIISFLSNQPGGFYGTYLGRVGLRCVQ